MVEEESNKIALIMFIAIFFIVMLFCVVVIINALNSGNTTSGTTVSNQTIEAISNENTTVQSLFATNYYNSACTINNVSTIEGIIVDPSNYTINNCQITIK